MKKIGIIIVLLCLILFCQCGKRTEDRIEMGDYVLESITEERDGETVFTGEYRILKYNGESESIELPKKTDKGTPITEIGAWAFASNTYLRTVIIPDGIKSIESTAFYGCSNLETVTIGADVANISEWEVFSNCDRLSSFQVSEKNVRYASESNCLIDRQANSVVYGCYTSEIPEGIEQIGNCAFCEIDSLEGIVIPESVTEIGTFAFFGATSLREIYIRESVTVIDDGAFGKCPDIQISCEASSKPEGWSEIWVYEGTSVAWGVEKR